MLTIVRNGRGEVIDIITDKEVEVKIIELNEMSKAMMDLAKAEGRSLHYVYNVLNNPDW